VHPSFLEIETFYEGEDEMGMYKSRVGAYILIVHLRGRGLA